MLNGNPERYVWILDQRREQGPTLILEHLDSEARYDTLIAAADVRPDLAHVLESRFYLLNEKDVDNIRFFMDAGALPLADAITVAGAVRFGVQEPWDEEEEAGRGNVRQITVPEPNSVHTAYLFGKPVRVYCDVQLPDGRTRCVTLQPANNGEVYYPIGSIFALGQTRSNAA